MPKEDWLQKEINRLAQLLAKLLRFKLAGEDTAIVTEVNESLKGITEGLDDGLHTAHEMANKLLERIQTAEQAQSLSAVFKEKALAQERLGDRFEALKSFEIALRLAVWADEQGGIFSFQNEGNIEFLKGKISGVN